MLLAILLIFALVLMCANCYFTTSSTALVKEIHKDIRTASERVANRQKNAAFQSSQAPNPRTMGAHAAVQKLNGQMPAMPAMNNHQERIKTFTPPMPTSMQMQREYPNSNETQDQNREANILQAGGQRFPPRGNDPTSMR